MTTKQTCENCRDCGNCKFSKPNGSLGPYELICCRYPKRIHFCDKKNGRQHSMYPEVFADDWCGEWKKGEDGNGA